MNTTKSSVQVHQIKIDFNVTEQIKRFVYVYIVEANNLKDLSNHK